MIDFQVTESVPDESAQDVSTPDVIPPTVDIEYPCRKCGREAGPYGGRGRKPTLCTECKTPASRKSNRVTGSNARLAEQAAEVLSQVNAMLALGAGSMRMFSTASAIASYDDTFTEQAKSALLTDPDLCRFILKGGVKSAKISLLMAYGGMAVAVAPTAMAEIKEIQAAKKAAKNAAV